MKVEDLDVLKPEPRMVRLGGKDIDVSFIPCGITFEIDDLVSQLRNLDESAVQAGGEEARKAFSLSVKLCAVFCSFKHPELDEEWFLANASPQQLEAFTNAVRAALVSAYAGIGDGGPPVKAKAKKRA